MSLSLLAGSIVVVVRLPAEAAGELYAQLFTRRVTELGGLEVARDKGTSHRVCLRSIVSRTVGKLSSRRSKRVPAQYSIPCVMVENSYRAITMVVGIGLL